MKIAVALIAFVLLVPGRAAADVSLWMEFLNSDLTFGSVIPDQSGWDLSGFYGDVNGRDIELDDYWWSGYQAFGGPLVRHTLVKNAAGEVTESVYLYRGGTFEIDLDFSLNGVNTTGSFLAPIRKLEIVAGEGEHSWAFAFYTLGPGLFDASIADAFGIRRRTAGGTVYSDLLVEQGNRGCCGGDHTTPERQAWDGVADVDISVPEPSVPVLGGVGLGAAWLRSRAARRLRP